MPTAKTAPKAKTKSAEAPHAYCVKCKASREMRDIERITMKNDRPATRGMCPVCGTKMFKIGAG